MKQILITMICVLAPCVGGALTMCVRDSSLVVSLDQSIGGSSYSHNASEMLWWTEFSYGRIYGEATCLSEAEGGKPSGSMGEMCLRALKTRMMMEMTVAIAGAG